MFINYLIIQQDNKLKNPYEPFRYCQRQNVLWSTQTVWNYKRCHVHIVGFQKWLSSKAWVALEMILQKLVTLGTKICVHAFFLNQKKYKRCQWAWVELTKFSKFGKNKGAHHQSCQRFLKSDWRKFSAARILPECVIDSCILT